LYTCEEIYPYKHLTSLIPIKYDFPSYLRQSLPLKG
jgi:hypothetical protein